MIKLNAQIRVQRLAGKVLLIPSSSAGGPLQAKTVWPSHDEQIIVPDEDYYGLVSVTVRPVPRLPFCSVSLATDYGMAVTIGKTVNIAVECDLYKVEHEPQYYTYNGTRLPEIPDGNEDKPYAVIYQEISSGDYYLCLSDEPFVENTYLGTSSLGVNGSSRMYRYAEDFPDWLYRGKAGTFTIRSNSSGSLRPLIWASRDILDTDDKLYFEGTTPELAE